MRRFLLAVAVLFSSIIGSARAADVQAQTPIMYASVPVSAPFSTWTACYLGANVGFGVAHTNLSEAFPVASSTGFQAIDGIVGGGQIGCDYQVGSFVFGIQGMFSGSSIVGNTASTLPAGTNQTPFFADPRYATGTGRVGFTVAPAVLAYVKVGGAWANSVASGLTVGGGLEWKFLPNWTMFAEYNHLDFGTTNVPFSSATVSGKASLDTALFGINYSFDIFSSATTRY